MIRKENDEKNKLKVIFELSDLLYSKIRDENLSNWEKNLSKIEQEQQHDARYLTLKQANLLFVERAMKWLTATIPNRLTLDLQNVEKVMKPIKKSVYKEILKRASKTIEEEMKNISNILEKLCNSHTTFNMVELMLVDEKVYEEKLRLLKNAKIDIEIHQKTSGLPSYKIEHVGGQKKDYENYKYKCSDKLYIPGERPIQDNCRIILNGKDTLVDEANFKLLLRLVIQIKNSKNEGWVNMPDVITDESPFKTVNDYHNYIYRLRKDLKHSLINQNPSDFIENNPLGNYRISTHPGNITYNKENLMKNFSNDQYILELAKQLP